MPLNNAEKCKNYRNRKRDATLRIKKDPLTPAERSRMYRLRRKQLAQGIKSSVNEVLYTPPTLNSRMTFEPSPQPVTTGQMKDSIEMNRNMDRRIYQAPSINALNTTSQGPQWNLQMFTPILKQETVQCFKGEEISQFVDGEETSCNNYMFPYKPLQSLNCVNYYDNKFCVSGKVKKEFPEDINGSIDNKIVSQNAELSKVLRTQEIRQENSEESFAYIKREEIHDKTNQIIIKTEVTEEHSILDNVTDTNVFYEVPITPQEIQPEMCGEVFRNRFNLLTHNNQHIKVEPPTLVGNETTELHKCQCCDEYFNNYDDMLTHFGDVHSNKNPKSELYNVGKKPHVNGRNGEEMEYKCDSCERVYKSRATLLTHTKKFHYNYGEMFKCWCGEEFPTPIHLRDHNYRHHADRVKNKHIDRFECDSCHKVFKAKSRLVRHINSVHCDYGKTFDCWCGKQFRTPIHLRDHKYRHHGGRVKIKKNNKFECNSCYKIFKYKSRLVRHINSVHYDYGKLFECWCGKQFRSPFHLSLHKKRQHGGIDNEQYQCGSCHTIFKTKDLLKEHIISAHYDNGKLFECWCGKQFRSPVHLSLHNKRQNCTDIINGDNKQFQCDYCHTFFKTKLLLIKHIKRVHYDYGKLFECWCGKQFRTPIYLRLHKYGSWH